MTEPTQVTTDDTRYLLPSEIARLVYGYLKQNHCDEVAEKFLNMSPHMKECLEMRNKHFTFMTKAHSLTLEEISNQCLKMNEILLQAANKWVNQPKKFHDAVEALRFIIDPSSLKDCTLVNEEPVSIDDNAFSDISLDINSSFKQDDRIDVPKLPESHRCSESTSKEVEVVDKCKKRFSTSFKNNARPARHLDQNAVLNKSGKVKVLRPRHTLPVAGKTMLRHDVSGEQDISSSNRLTEGEPPSPDLEPPSPGSSSREDNFDSELVDSDKNPLETSSKVAVETDFQFSSHSQCTEGTENSSNASSRSRRKKNSGTLNAEQMNKSSSNKLVPEIEVDHMLIQQTLIKNPKIHERIAENINKVISESPQKKTSADPIDELNSTVKKVADETINDPLCKEIINELLGCLTNVNLCLENEQDDMDGSNLTFPDKFYENVSANDSNFQPGDLVETNVPVSETNTGYQNMQGYVSMSTEQQETGIIFVGEVPESNQNHSANQNYGVETHQENAISNSSANAVDIRSYFTNTPDIKESCDNVETINGTVINVLEPAYSNLISVQNPEDGNQYCVTRSVPFFFGSTSNSSTTTLAPALVNSKKRSARIQPCVFPSTRVIRRLTPIAPKPNPSGAVENQPTLAVSKDNHPKRPTKKIKK